jgi:hypothetical protein
VQRAFVPAPGIGMIVDAIQEKVAQPGYFVIIQWSVETIHSACHLALKVKPL